MRRPRLEEVAADVGLSTATVSLVLRGLAGPSTRTRDRVLEAAARLGYRTDRAASALASKRSRLIGVVVDVANPFHTQLIEDVHESAQRHGCQLLLSAVTRTQDETRAIETLVDSRCAALLLLGSELPAARLAALAGELPVAVVGRPVQAAGVDVVRTADDDGLSQAVAHLAGLGHRRITHVDGGRRDIAVLRRRAYRSAMRRRGLADHISIVAGGDTETAGSQAAQTLLNTAPPPTAVIAFNDRCALGLIDALIRVGVDIPGTLSVVGYDDSALARLRHINLTTVSQNSQQLTEQALAALLQRLDNAASDERDVVVPPHLVVRGTTTVPVRAQLTPTPATLLTIASA